MRRRGRFTLIWADLEQAGTRTTPSAIAATSTGFAVVGWDDPDYTYGMENSPVAWQVVLD